MTGTTAQKPSGDDGTELPRPRGGSRWRWSRPHQALAAGGVLAAVLSLGAAGVGADAATATPGGDTVAPGRPAGGMARPTVSGKITALHSDDIIVETHAKTTVTVVASSSTTFKSGPGPSGGATSSASALEDRRLHRRAGHREQRRLRCRVERHDRPAAADGQSRSGGPGNGGRPPSGGAPSA